MSAAKEGRPSDTAVIVVNYRTMVLTRDAVVSVLAEPEVTEVVVVDNASGDGSADYLRDQLADARVRVVEAGDNWGFAPAVNRAAALCGAPLLLILNSDATLVPGSLRRLADALLADAAVGVVAPAVYERDGRRLQPGAFGRLPTRLDLVGNRWARPGRAGDERGVTEPGWVSGVAMLMRRSEFVALGGFDEAFGMYFEDLDLCRRLRATGKSVRREPAAGVVHRGGGSWHSRKDQKRRFHESKLRYFANLGASPVELRCVRLVGIVRTGVIPRGR